MLQSWLQVFLHDTKIHIALLLVLADLVLGVLAALKRGNFRLSYFADFLRNDILFKLIPYFAFYVFALIAGKSSILVSFLNFGVLAGSVYATIVAAWAASILSSVGTLFPTVQAKVKNPKAQVALFGAENEAPPKS